MATLGQLKSVEFKQAGLVTTAASAPREALASEISTGGSATVMKSPATARSITAPTVKSPTSAVSPVASAAAKATPASPRFTAEEAILLRGLASGASSKEMATQMRLPRESLYRLIGDLRRKTGASSDGALAVWVLRNMSTAAGERRGGSR